MSAVKRRHGMTIGQRIRELRVAAGLTQEAAAAKAGLRQSHWSLLERRDGSRISAGTLRRLAKALDVTVDELLR